VHLSNHSSPELPLREVFWPICERLLVKDTAAPTAEDDILRLTVQMVKGDEDAYRDFYARFFGRLFGYLLVLARGHEDTAREALQCAMLRVVRHIRRFENENPFWSWLAVLARTSLVDLERKRCRYNALIERFVQNSILPTASEAESRLLECLRESVTQLSPDERNLVERKYFEHQEVAQIAIANDLSEKAVESRLTRIRAKLKVHVLTLLQS